jgi:peptidyl-prolyl cis-trans isomerase SurA
MKKQFNLLFTLLILFTFTINAQDYKEEVLITIDGKEITAGEFERIYNKNNNENISQNQTIEEYLDMFINFKLKVREAENLGMDTAQSFLKEFNSYRDQLAQPYLADSEAVDRFAREAYNRMKKEIHASHIMVRIDERADPADTLYAYEKSMEIRQKLLDGEDFETLARATSDDPSAKNNGGDLGWFSVFRMVLPFEDAAFNTPAGEISMPVRTQYGYHLIKVHEIRDARGSVKTAHIYIRVPESMGEKESLDAKNRVSDAENGRLIRCRLSPIDNLIDDQARSCA